MSCALGFSWTLACERVLTSPLSLPTTERRCSCCKSGHPGSRRPRESGSHPDAPARQCARGHRRGFNTLRARAQIRGETGSLETAPSATQSRGCSHSGIAPGLTAVFSLYVGRFRRSREKRRRNEGRPRRGGSRSAGDRLASRVSWSGVGAPGTPARGRRMVDRTSARPNAVARVSQQGGWIPAIFLECPGSNF